MTTTSFTENDCKELDMRIRVVWLQVALVLGLGIVGGGIIAAIGQDISLLLMMVVAVAALTAVLMALPIWRLFTDKTEQRKLCGEIVVEKDVTSDRYFTYFYICGQLGGKKRKMQVTKAIYDVVLPGEKLYVEIAARSSYPFQVRRDGVSILPGK